MVKAWLAALHIGEADSKSAWQAMDKDGFDSMEFLRTCEESEIEALDELLKDAGVKPAHRRRVISNAHKFRNSVQQAPSTPRNSVKQSTHSQNEVAAASGLELQEEREGTRVEVKHQEGEIDRMKQVADDLKEMFKLVDEASTDAEEGSSTPPSLVSTPKLTAAQAKDDPGLPAPDGDRAGVGQAVAEPWDDAGMLGALREASSCGHSVWWQRELHVTLGLV